MAMVLNIWQQKHHHYLFIQEFKNLVILEYNIVQYNNSK